MNVRSNITVESPAPMPLAVLGNCKTQAPLQLWLVDDKAEVRSAIADLLCRDGAIECARQFSSAEALLRALKHHPAPQAILMDVQMEGMSGIEAIEPVRMLAPSTHIFIMTTFYDGDLAARAYNAGATTFLLKQNDAEVMAGRILKLSAEPVPTPAWQAVRRWGVAACLRPAADVASAAPRPLLTRAIGVLRTFL